MRCFVRAEVFSLQQTFGGWGALERSFAESPATGYDNNDDSNGDVTRSGTESPSDLRDSLESRPVKRIFGASGTAIYRLVVSI
jgi:hypothetical protein